MTDLIAELADELRRINAYCELPDGDGVSMSVALWAERWADRLHESHATLPRILTDYAAIRAAHHDLVIRLGEVTTELEAARKDAERYRWMRENEWDEPVVKLYDGDFDNASGETLDSAIDAAMKESGK